MITMKLRNPIQAHDKKVSEITLRKPTGNDFVKCGLPFKFSATGREIDTVATNALIGRLADIPTSAAGSLEASDWIDAMAIVLDFLGDTTETSYTTTSLSDTSMAA
jgi:hypothetical protein